MRINVFNTENKVNKHSTFISAVHSLRLRGLLHPNVDIGNPGSMCVTRDITRVNYREHMRRSLGLKIC